MIAVGMMTDTRTIESVDVYPFGDDSAYFSTSTKKGPYAADEIEVYEECLTERWVRVIKDEQVIFRVAAVHCSIRYRCQKAEDVAS